MVANPDSCQEFPSDTLKTGKNEGFEVKTARFDLPTPLFGQNEGVGRPEPRPLGIQRAADAEAGFLHHVGIDLRRRHILVTEEVLNRPDVVPAFEKVRGKRMPERVTTRGLGQPGRADGNLDGALEAGLVNVMPAAVAAARVGGEAFGREDVLPRPFAVRVRILLGQGVGQIDATVTGGQIVFMQAVDAFQMGLEFGLQTGRQHRDPVFLAFAIADEDLIAREAELDETPLSCAAIEVFDAQAQAFQQPHPGPIE